MTSIPGEEIDELHVTFKEFVKLPFTQKFPDLLFAIAHFLLGDFATSFLCNYFNLHKYRVITQDQQITIRRVPKTILNYPRIIDTQWIILKQEIKSSKLKPDLSYSLLKGIVSSFLLACEIEAACTYRIFNCTSASLKEASYIILGKYCPTLMQGIFDHMTDNNSANVGVLEFIDYFEGFFKKETVHRRMFDLYDVNGDGEVSVLEIIALAGTEETKVSKDLDSEVNLLSEILEQKRRNGEPGKGALRYQQYINYIPIPTFPEFLRSQMKINHKNRTSLAQKRLQLLNL